MGKEQGKEQETRPEKEAFGEMFKNITVSNGDKKRALSGGTSSDSMQESASSKSYSAKMNRYVLSFKNPVELFVLA